MTTRAYGETPSLYHTLAPYTSLQKKTAGPFGSGRLSSIITALEELETLTLRVLTAADWSALLAQS
jgi:hypothetical protein